MKGEISNIIKVACIYMATIIGAGFASGQEILQFFSTYYEGGFYGIIMAGILFSVLGAIILDKVYAERIRNYDEFLIPTLGHSFGRIMELIVTVFMVSVYCIMIAGLGNVLSDNFGIPFNYGVVLMSVLCMVVIISDIKGIVSLSTIISPVLIAGIIIVGIYILASKDTSAFNPLGGLAHITNNWFFSALLYVSYNSIIATVVMCSLLPYLKTRKTGIAGGILGGLFLCAAAFILNLAIFTFYPGIMSSEIPVLNIVAKYSWALSVFYSIILWLAMFVSAVTSGYCFVERVRSKANVNLKFIALIMCALAIPLSNFGFSNLIANLYSFFGFMGLFLMFVILIQGVGTPFLRRVQTKQKSKL